MYKIGVVGLGVMGANLARNIASKGFPVAGYDLDAAKTQAFASGQPDEFRHRRADAPERLMAVLERPRRVLMMVPAVRRSTASSRIFARTLSTTTSSSTAATRFSAIPIAAPTISPRRDSASSAWACPAARKARSGGRR